MSGSWKIVVRSLLGCERFAFETFGGAVAYARHMYQRSNGIDFDCVIDGPNGRHELEVLLPLFDLG